MKMKLRGILSAALALGLALLCTFAQAVEEENVVPGIEDDPVAGLFAFAQALEDGSFVSGTEDGGEAANTGEMEYGDETEYDGETEYGADAEKEYDAEAATRYAPDTTETTGAQLYYVTDEADLLTDEEWNTLEQQAQAVAEMYSFGVYIVTVNDYRDFGAQTVEECAVAIYDGYSLGLGETRDGLLLLLSMDDRDYDLDAYGYGNVAFTDYGKQALASEFLDDFRDDRWYDGFYDYISAASTMISQAKAGTPVDVDAEWEGYESNDRPSPMQVLIYVVLIPCALSGLICMGMLARMKTVRHASRASQYVVQNGFFLRASSDQYTHTTESRVKIEKENRSGGTSVGSSGHSHSSGKF